MTYLYEIGKALGYLGYELCQQAIAPEPLNIHGQVKQTVDNLCYNPHNPVNLIMNGKSEDVSQLNIETIMATLQHPLHSSHYI